MRGATPQASAEVFLRFLGPEFDYASARKLRTQLVEREIQDHGLPVKPGLKPLLETLAGNGIRAAVASSSPSATVQRYLSMAGITDYFQAVVSGEDAARSKPAPDVFLLAARRLNALPGRCLVLEDSQNGLRGAHAAGMHAICVPDLSMPEADALADTDAVLPTLWEVWPWLRRSGTSFQ